MTQATRERQRDADDPNALVIHFGNEELIVQRRYQALSILNDFLIGLWFLIGSVCFFSPAWKEVGIWLFVLGSAQLLIRPMIRLAHRMHLYHAPGGSWDL